MSLAAILAQVVDDVESVITTGKVHLGLRQFSSREFFKAACTDSVTGRLNCWFVTRGKSTETPHSTGSHLRKHPITIAGFVQVYDPTYDPTTVAVGSEMLSESLISGYTESISTVLRNDAQLHGILAVNTTAPQVTAWDIQSLDESPCHHVEIQVEITEEVLVAFV